MSIWVYQDTLLDPSKDEVQRDTCLFCKERLVNLDQQSDWNHYAALRACEICGWWSKHRTIVSQGAGGEYFTLYGTCARLKSLDIADISTPIDEVNSTSSLSMRSDLMYIQGCLRKQSPAFFALSDS